MQTEQASPEEQEEYDRAVAAMSDIIFKQKDQQILQFIQKEQSPITGAVNATQMVVSAVDQQMNLSEGLAPHLADEAFNMIVELAESEGIQFDEKGKVQGAAAAQQAVLQLFGADAEGYGEAFGGLDEPTANLDPYNVGLIEDLVRQQHRCEHTTEPSPRARAPRRPSGCPPFWAAGTWTSRSTCGTPARAPSERCPS
jgi:hypothetical protein